MSVAWASRARSRFSSRSGRQRKAASSKKPMYIRLAASAPDGKATATTNASRQRRTSRFTALRPSDWEAEPPGRGRGWLVRPRAPAVRRPAEVHRPASPAPEVVDLLPRVRADVADVQIAGRAVEREAPGIAQAVRDHLGLDRLAADVDANQLPEQARRILRRGERVAVAHADVEPSVGPESELAAVV